MAFEIERKFLVTSDAFKAEAESATEFEQAYISTDPDATVRLRIIDGSSARLTIKSRNHGAVRHEWEYDIPVDDARSMMMNMPVSAMIRKTRYRVGRWEVDCFHAPCPELTVAEIELTSADEPIGTLPAWIGEEVTGDPATTTPPSQPQRNVSDSQ